MIKNIIRIMSVTLVILFFVPTVTVSCHRTDVTFTAEISSYNAASGKFEYELSSAENETFSEKRAGAHILFLLPLLAGIIAWGTISRPIITVLSAFLNVIMIIWMNKYHIVSFLSNKGIEGVVEIEYTPAYPLYIVINIAIIIAVFCGFANNDKKDG
ncbi:MAG: hypothetical protein E7672_02380 [Ruminococcaceae bacterium]|nr:hypothetical protein [Oscillospiraceae bacterium]